MRSLRLSRTLALPNERTERVKPRHLKHVPGAPAADPARRTQGDGLVEPIAMNHQLRKQLVDETMDAYVAWREACAAVWEAYERWSRPRSAEAQFAFWEYQSALHGEETAAQAYGKVLRYVAGIVDGGLSHPAAAAGWSAAAGR
jgi:hypothetical protein